MNGERLLVLWYNKSKGQTEMGQYTDLYICFICYLLKVRFNKMLQVRSEQRVVSNCGRSQLQQYDGHSVQC